MTIENTEIKNKTSELYDKTKGISSDISKMTHEIKLSHVKTQVIGQATIEIKNNVGKLSQQQLEQNNKIKELSQNVLGSQDKVHEAVVQLEDSVTKIVQDSDKEVQSMQQLQGDINQYLDSSIGLENELSNLLKDEKNAMQTEFSNLRKEINDVSKMINSKDIFENIRATKTSIKAMQSDMETHIVNVSKINQSSNEKLDAIINIVDSMFEKLEKQSVQSEITSTLASDLRKTVESIEERLDDALIHVSVKQEATLEDLFSNEKPSTVDPVTEFIDNVPCDDDEIEKRKELPLIEQSPSYDMQKNELDEEHDDDEQGHGQKKGKKSIWKSLWSGKV